MVVIPAGVAHKNEGASERFSRRRRLSRRNRPRYQQYGKPGEQPATDRQIAAVPLPTADPVLGREGPLARLWHVPADTRGGRAARAG